MNYIAHIKISEYLIRPELPVPVEVIDKIQVHHANPMSYVRSVFGHPIYVSKNSGYRPEEHELEKGRTDLTTEHLFRPIDRPGSEDGLGAADYITELSKMGELATLTMELTGYSRICFYPDVARPFFHCDYRFRFSTPRTYISTGSWTQVSHEDFLEKIHQTTNQMLS